MHTYVLSFGCLVCQSTTYHYLPFILLYEGGCSPSLQELALLPVAAKWYRLGVQLGVKANDLDVIADNHQQNAEMCQIKMFTEWLRGGMNTTNEKLVRALAAVGERKLAETLRSAQGM